MRNFWNTYDQLYFTFYLQRNPNNQAIRIYISKFDGIGIYNMNMPSKILGLPGSNGSLNNYFNFSDDNSYQQYITNTDYTGIVNITHYNVTSKIISGTFQFKAQNYNGSNDSVIVTDGRFDCKID